MKKMVVKSGREKSLLRRHPWIFAGAIARSDAVASGDVLRVVAEDGRFLATAVYSAGSRIAARALSFDEREIIDADFYRRRLAAAATRRTGLEAATDAWRVVHGESDGLPGLVVDRYADAAVVQLTTAGIDGMRAAWGDWLGEQLGVAAVYERSDVDVRALEGLAPCSGWLRGQLPEGGLTIREHGIDIEVDIVGGHKTGFYLDQRDNRARTQAVAREAEVLNVFCYTGTMSVAAMRGGAAGVLSIDSSAAALAAARRIAARNGCNVARMEWWEADAFQALRKLRDQGRAFDLVILDPPKLAPTAQHVEKAARAYKDINLLGLKLLRPGGRLMTYSCSGGVSADLFQKIVAGAAVDARVDAQIHRRLAAGIDHPVSIHFPEGEYLKGLEIVRL